MAFLTYFDLVESLIVSSFGGPQDAEQRDIRAAIHRAYDELTTLRDWQYYHVHGRVLTDAPYTTGTVTYVAATRTLTLTGGTWPSWAAQGHVRVGNVIGRVQTRVSDTVLTMDSQVNFKGDFTGETFSSYRMEYPLPDDFRNMDEPSDEYNWWAGLYITPDDAMKLERVSNSSGEPYHWTIVPRGPDWSLKLVGYPTGQETIDFSYRRTARPLRFSGHEASARVGTIARTDAAVTGTTTAFVAPMVGAILRVGDTTRSPGPIESLTPWIAESKITAVGSATGLTTEDSGTVAALTKYLITDPIDLPQHLYQVMDSCADYHLARIRGSGEDRAFSMFQRDLRLAMERDQLAPLSGRSRQMFHDGGWLSPRLPDQG